MTVSERETVRLWVIEVRVRGVRGRDRTVKTHVLPMGTLPDTGVVPTEGVPGNEACKAAIASAGVRAVERATLWLMPCIEYRTFGDTTMRETSPFDQRIIKTEIVL